MPSLSPHLTVPRSIHCATAVQPVHTRSRSSSPQKHSHPYSDQWEHLNIIQKYMPQDEFQSFRGSERKSRRVREREHVKILKYNRVGRVVEGTELSDIYKFYERDCEVRMGDDWVKNTLCQVTRSRSFQRNCQRPKARNLAQCRV